MGGYDSLAVKLREKIIAVLRTIPDPEMPISIVDLGIVEDVAVSSCPDREAATVSITILPTFVGCPALDMIRDEVIAKVSRVDGVADVAVEFIYDPPWTVDRISEVGRASLKEHGVTVPESGSRLAVHDQPRVTTQIRTSAVPCPFCDSTATYLESPFGPTRCRMIYYCNACKNTFEHMKRV